MDVLIFDLKGSLAHFRRPDTTAAHASYPFITRTALRGLLAAVLGLDAWPEDAWTGVRLMRPVATRVQQLSLLGKGFLATDKTFNRMTTVELVTQPWYRIYYAGALIDRLDEFIRTGRCVYPTYLGSAFAMTRPDWVDRARWDEWMPTPESPVVFQSVVPAHVLSSLDPSGGAVYARVGGILYQGLPGRRFEGMIHMIYERSLKPLRGRWTSIPADPPVRVAYPRWGEGMVALW